MTTVKDALATMAYGPAPESAAFAEAERGTRARVGRSSLEGAAPDRRSGGAPRRARHHV